MIGPKKNIAGIDRTPKIHYGILLTRCGLSRGRGIKTQVMDEVNCLLCLKLSKEGLGRVHARKLEAISPRGDQMARNVVAKLQASGRGALSPDAYQRIYDYLEAKGEFL